MIANTTHNPPKTPIEDLGDGTFYYNFNVVHSTITDEEGNTFDNYDYYQVRCRYPENKEIIQSKIDKLNIKHTVDL